MSLKSKKIIIIGTGVAGLATAARLASKGFEVEVFEKNGYPGGKLSSFKNGPFSFDAGPSLFTAPHLLEELFQFSNEPIENYFSYKKQDISFKYFYDDGTIVNAYTNNEKLAKEFNEKLGEEIDNTISYLEASKKLYNKTGVFFLNNSLHKIKTYFNKNIFKVIRITKIKYIFETLHQYNFNQFVNTKTVQLFNRFATYNGSNPYKAPAMLSLIPHLELNDGTYYPKGGMIAITNALFELCKHKGVTFKFNKNVDSIIASNNVVKGIVVENENIFADYVISNGDVYFTYKHLLKNEISASKVLRQERSSSAVIFYWGINKDYKELELHNILFSDNYQAEFNAIFNESKLYNDPTVYINITSKCEPGIQAPIGKENWFVMVNVPSKTSFDWDNLIPEIRLGIINKINSVLKTNVQNFIESESVLHPKLIEIKTSSYLGSLYGTSSNSKFSAFLRHPNFSNRYKGLFFVGGSVHPGGGIPLCLQSAKITAEMICKDSL